MWCGTHEERNTEKRTAAAKKKTTNRKPYGAEWNACRVQKRTTVLAGTYTYTRFGRRGSTLSERSCACVRTFYNTKTWRRRRLCVRVCVRARSRHGYGIAAVGDFCPPPPRRHRRECVELRRMVRRWRRRQRRRRGQLPAVYCQYSSRLVVVPCRSFVV